ncbi:hypothetical protein KI387_043058, partial [Taxus chinensis]
GQPMVPLNWNEEYLDDSYAQITDVMRRTLNWMPYKNIDLSIQSTRVLNKFRDLGKLKDDLPPLKEGDDRMDPLGGKSPQFPLKMPTLGLVDEWNFATSGTGTFMSSLKQKTEEMLLKSIQNATITFAVPLQSKGK